MGKKAFTEEQEEYIKNNYLYLMDKLIAEVLDCDVDKIKRYRNNHGLKKYTNRVITKEEEKFMIENFNIMSYSEIANNLGLTTHQVIGHLNYLGFSRIGKYDCSYFHKIDNPTKAYWIGFIYADGTVGYNESNRWYSFAMVLQKQDKYILEELNAHFENGGTFYEYNTDMSIMGYKRKSVSEMCLFRLNRKELVEDLISHNILPNKTYRTEFPVLEDAYFFDFLRGYMDGDGCICIDKKHHNYPTVSFVGNNFLLLDYIKNKMLNNYSITSSLYKRKDKETYQLSFQGTNAIFILNKMYEDLHCVKLIRKYNKYLLAIEWLTFHESEKLKRAKSVEIGDNTDNTEVTC